MASASRGATPRPFVVAAVALAALALGGVPAASQSPSVPVPSMLGASPAPVASTPPVDVSSIRWKESKPSKGFDPGQLSAIVNDLAVGAGGRMLLVGAYNQGMFDPVRAAVWGSDDGVRWTRLKGSLPAGSQAWSVIATDAGFLIAGDVGSGPLLLSSDGSGLEVLDTPADGLPTGRLLGLAESPLGLLAAGTDDGGIATVWRSTDGGGSWTGSPIPGAAYVVHVAATDAGSVIVLGSQQDANGTQTPTIWGSADAMTWEPRPMPVEPGGWSVPDLERTPLGLIATLASRDGGASAWLSTDGITWTRLLEAPERLVVGTVGDAAILLGDGRWWHSVDGVTWTMAEARPMGGYQVEATAVRPDGAVIAAGWLEDLTRNATQVRTWVGRPPA